MTIWIYEGISRQPEYVWSKNTCTFCKNRLELLHKDDDQSHHAKGVVWFTRWLWICHTCGWWKAEGLQDVDDFAHSLKFAATYGAAASLRELDLSDVSTPIKDIRSYLAAKFERRFDLKPRLLEETVASIFRDHGYHAIVTAYSGDDGVDVILHRGNETIGVQVKRYKDAIEVEQIRSLAGALVLRDMTHGIFVTTSTFQRGAESTADRFETRGYKIELVDAQRFYDALKLAQRTMYGSFADFPVGECLNHLVMIEDRVIDERDRFPPF
jgi:restriction system protein